MKDQGYVAWLGNWGTGWWMKPTWLTMYQSDIRNVFLHYPIQ